MAKEGTWEEEDKSDGTFLLVIEAGGVDQRAAWVLGTFTFVCKKKTPQTASLPLSHCGPGTDRDCHRPLQMAMPQLSPGTHLTVNILGWGCVRH